MIQLEAIRFSPEDQKRIDQICAKYDPAKLDAMKRELDLIPNATARRYALDYKRTQLRANVELCALQHAVRKYAVERGEIYRAVLTTWEECGVFGIVGSELKNFNESTSDAANRYWDVVETVDGDGYDNLGDRIVDACSDNQWLAMEEAAGRPLRSRDEVSQTVRKVTCNTTTRGLPIRSSLLNLAVNCGGSTNGS